MKLRKTVLVTPVALATLALVGCGGGSDNNNQTAATPVQAGETLNSRVLLDGVEVQKTVYRVYNVADDKGTLSSTPLANVIEEQSLPHVLIVETTANTPNAAGPMAYGLQAQASLPSTLDEYRACYSEFWKAMQKYYPNRDKAYIAKRLNDFNMTVDELCVKQASSNLDMDAYIEMFKVVLKYWPNDPLIEGKVANFFVNIKTKPGTFKQTLNGLGYSWEDFARRLSNDSKGATGFANSYELSPLALEPFLRVYMTQQQPGPMLAMIQKNLHGVGTLITKNLNKFINQPHRNDIIYAQNAPTGNTVQTYTDAVKQVVDAADKVFELGVKVWNFIDPGDAKLNIDAVAKNGTTVTNYVVSNDVPSTLNYEYAKASETKVISFIGDSWRGVAYKVDMVLSADYDATNPAAPGQWIPNFGVVVKSAQVAKGYDIVGTAAVSNVVNRGSLAAPIPEAQVDLKLTASNWTINSQTFSFLVNGATGAKFKN